MRAEKPTTPIREGAPEWRSWTVRTYIHTDGSGAAKVRVGMIHASGIKFTMTVYADWRPGEEREDVEARALQLVRQAFEGLTATLDATAARLSRGRG